MSDKQELEKAIDDYKEAVEHKRVLVKEAVERVETVRQVKTELPNR